MRVPRVRTETGQVVTLLFTPDEVEVHEVRPARQQAAKLGAGGLILAAGLALVATTVGLVLWIVCAVLLAVSAAGLIWWLIEGARERDRGPAATITPASVLSADSKTDNGEVTVTLRQALGPDRTFAAVGHSGALLSAQFGRLLAP
ncbi:hypothetical protein OWR29_02435 [Actinoplanes sp. Pm04-4]|jgi:hypothetical protein|uniref:Uncharacterized protein n=1 Tax=Paractinoplanes pyxinae TaxID=2997416 RepID=A0ABT4ARH9_9ACTN|nr:hypothetical protein [Actinoplanes pyxinae]MCY1136839.1 hypothetical protein [Actinoplanes pyxinae]